MLATPMSWRLMALAVAAFAGSASAATNSTNSTNSTTTTTLPATNTTLTLLPTSNSTTTVVAPPAATPVVPPSSCVSCDPYTNPCSQTASCVSTGTAWGALCLCRPGYMNSAPNSSGRIVWPVAGQEHRVFVGPGEPCEQLCPDWTMGATSCSAVPVFQQVSEVCPSDDTAPLPV